MMTIRLLFAACLLLGLSTSCQHSGPAPIPPAIFGSTWDLSSQTVAVTAPTGVTTTATTSVPSGAYSITYPGDGTYRLFTGGATATGKCDYDGKTITLYNTVGSSPTRVLTVSTVTTTQLVTVEKTQDATNYYTTTSTFTRL